MISVIVPTFNRAAFIEKALVSILNQTCPCDEVLVIDDGSSDATEAIVSRISRQSKVEVRYIYQQNMGASAARNRGIAEARCDILCFLDSDDWWDVTKLELQLTAMEQEPDYLVSHTRELWHRHGKRVNQRKKHLPPQGDIFCRSLEMCVVGMSTVMARRQLFERYGFFDESLLCCEDYDLWLRVGRIEKFLLIDEPLTLKDGGRQDQLSAIHRLGMDKWRIRSICNLLENCTLTPEQHRLALAELHRKCTIYGNGCIKHGRPEEGEHYLTLPENYLNCGLEPKTRNKKL